MTTVYFDGELIHQVVPLMPISGNHGHHAVFDSSGSHMLFSIGDHGEFFLLRPDGFNAQYSLLDLRPHLKLDKATKVTAVAVSQDLNRNIYIALVTQGETDSSANVLHVLRPQTPAFFEGLHSDCDVVDMVLSSEDSKPDAHIQRLFLGNVPDPTTGYPVLVAIYRRLDKDVVDAVKVEVSVTELKWQYDSQFQLPEDPSRMLDIACGGLPTGDFGLFCLYKMRDTTTLTFCSTSSPGITYGLQVREKATSLATFINGEGNTDLIVSGDQEIYHYTAFVCSQSFSNDQPPPYSVITSGPLLGGLQQLSVAQAVDDDGHNRLTIFSRNAESCVLYQSFGLDFVDDEDPDIGKVSILQAKNDAIQLFTAGDHGGRFASLVEPNTGSHKLFVTNETGSVMTLIEQNPVTELWQSLTLLVPSTGNNRDVATFTSHVKFSGPDNKALAFERVLLKASSAVDLAVNGKMTKVTTEGVIVTIDAMSTMTIIHNVDDISTVMLTLEDIPGQKDGVLKGSYTFDPSKKAQAKLKSLATESALREARLPSGDKLISDKITDGQLSIAALALKALGQKIDEISSSESRGTAPESVPQIVDQGSSWGLWHWLSNLGTNIKNWFVTAWEFVVETSEGVYRFILQTASHIMKAVTFVLQKAGVAFKKLAEFVAFLFDWDDIVDMKNILAKVVNTGIDTFGMAIDVFSELATDWFNDLDQSIASLDLPVAATDQKIDDQSASNNESTRALQSPAGNWSNYQLQHGDIGKSFSADASTAKESSGNPFASTWTEVIIPCFKKIRDLFTHLGANFVAIFQDKELSLGDLLKHMGLDLLRDLVGILRSLVIGLMKFSNILFKGLKDAMNAKIEVPILSALYRKISGGSDLTILDALCLLVAVPTTILYKSITGATPRDNPVFKELLENRLGDNWNEDPESSSNPSRVQLPSQKGAVAYGHDAFTAPTIDAFSLHTNSFVMQSTTRPSQALVQPTDYLQAVVDTCGGCLEGNFRMLVYCSRDLIKLLMELKCVFMPGINAMFAVSAAFEWAKPDLIDADVPEGASGDVYSPKSGIWVGLGILALVGSFPMDCLNTFLPSSWKITGRPAQGKRLMIWLLSMLNVPVLIILKRKKSLCRVQGLVAFIQLPLVYWTMYDQMSKGGVSPSNILASLDGAFAQITKISAALASNGNLAEPVSQISGVISGVSSVACIGSQTFIVKMNIKHGLYHECHTLFGM